MDYKPQLQQDMENKFQIANHITNMIKKCKHKNKHSQLVKGDFGLTVGQILFNGEYKSYEMPARNSVINVYCIDCGQKISVTELNDCKKLLTNE